MRNGHIQNGNKKKSKWNGKWWKCSTDKETDIAIIICFQNVLTTAMKAIEALVLAISGFIHWVYTYQFHLLHFNRIGKFQERIKRMSRKNESKRQWKRWKKHAIKWKIAICWYLRMKCNVLKKWGKNETFNDFPYSMKGIVCDRHFLSISFFFRCCSVLYVFSRYIDFKCLIVINVYLSFDHFEFFGQHVLHFIVLPSRISVKRLNNMRLYCDIF